MLLIVRLALLLCAGFGVSIPSPALRLVEATIVVPLAACAVFIASDYRRLQTVLPLSLRRLVIHEVRLFTSLLRWVARRGPQGVGGGDLAVRYAAGQVFLIGAFVFASVVETVALAVIIPWPTPRAVVLAIDLWGVYLGIALQASCVVRPHVVHADGSLRLRYGALLDIAVPADRIAHARVDRRHDRPGPAKLSPDGTLDMGIGGQTMVTVELNEPVTFTRPLGAQAEARVLRFYADDPSAAVVALRAAPVQQVAELP